MDPRTSRVGRGERWIEGQATVEAFHGSSFVVHVQVGHGPFVMELRPIGFDVEKSVEVTDGIVISAHPDQQGNAQPEAPNADRIVQQNIIQNIQGL